jgi:hypothetical protein
MRFRKLRIAFSVVCGIACVLLIALWVRSYFRLDDLSYRDIHISSLRGILFFNGEVFLDETTDEAGPTEFKLFRYTLFLYSNASHDVGVIGDEIAIPEWVLVGSTALIGVLPWIQWSNRFSLRSLLIATTLIAVMLGLIVWSIR